MRVLSCVAVLLVALVAVLVLPSTTAAFRRNYNGICACPKIYRPVCGSDLTTYANSCILRCKVDSSYGKSVQLRILRDGECERKTPIQIPEEILD
uniref:Kazal-like domain-containing protein n=1 Tax=Anopheles christyi TaxID=43041 RepID=A0A182KDX7_9DIPT